MSYSADNDIFFLSVMKNSSSNVIFLFLCMFIVLLPRFFLVLTDT